MIKAKGVCAVMITIIMSMALSMNTVAYAGTGILTQSNNAVSINDSKNDLMKEKQDKQQQLTDALDKKVSEGKKIVTSGAENIDMSIKDYSLAEAYKINLITPLMITTYNKDQTFSSILTDDFQWIVPVYNFSGEKGYATLIEKGDTIEWIGTAYSEGQGQLPDTIDSLISKLSTISTGSIEHIQYTYSQFYHVTFVYFNTVDGEYVIPFSNISNQLNITNGKVYSVKNLFSILNKTFDETIIINNPNSNGGLPFRTHAFPLQFILIISISFAAIIAIGFYLKSFFKKKKQILSNTNVNDF